MVFGPTLNLLDKELHNEAEVPPCFGHWCDSAIAVSILFWPNGRSFSLAGHDHPHCFQLPAFCS